MLIFKTLRDEPTDHESTDESKGLKSFVKLGYLIMIIVIIWVDLSK